MVMARLLRNRLESYVKNVNRAEADYQAGAAPYNSAIQAAGAGTLTVVDNQIVGGRNPDGSLMVRVTNILSQPPSLRDFYDAGGDLAGKIYGRDGNGTVRAYVKAFNQDTNNQEVQAREAVATLPPVPELVEPQQPNLTQSNIKELESPSADQAGLALQAAVGLQGKPQLAGDVANSKVSAFADPEDPNDMASRGILARTLAGQLG